MISFKVLKLYPEFIIVGPSQHVYVLVSKPKLAVWISEAVLVLLPVFIEALSWSSVIAAPLNHLNRWMQEDCFINITFVRLSNFFLRLTVQPPSAAFISQ